MKLQLVQAIQGACQQLFDTEVQVTLMRPEEQFGEYATNVAMQLAKQVNQNPRDIAAKLVKALEGHESIANVEVAGPGFLNIRLTDTALLSQATSQPQALYADKKVLLEYSCPNAFKELHTGHLYQTVVGDALGRILELSGAHVYRANFGGDVGLHVGKCLYGIREALDGDSPEKLADIPEADRPNWISKAYVAGSKAYEEDERAKTVIETLNKAVYGIHAANDRESALAQIYWTCREWSYTYFKNFYEHIEVKPFDKFYPESQTSDLGLEIINNNKNVFQDSNGAVVFDGEAVGLHTRVFVTSQGLPTYETKDLGVIYTEAKDFPFDKRIIMTGNDQSEYMKVVFAALSAINADLGAKQTHLTNGTVRFGDGQKMSSRLGNVSRAVEVLEVVSESVKDQQKTSEMVQSVTLGAIKYSFLKHRLGSDISFDISESVSLDGNSGPYLQYAHARAQSILRKSAVERMQPQDLDEAERSLVRALSIYPETVEKAASELMPHHVCTYLYELSQAFNRFYEHNRVIGDEREAIRVGLVDRYANTLKHGLALLGIVAPETM